MASPDRPSTIEAVTAALVERLETLMPAGGSYGRAALARLPDPIEHLLVAVLERRARREAALPESEWIDAEDGAVREAAKRWRDATREAARYPESEWPRALAEAARQALRHLIEPADAAGSFCFDGESGAIPFATVKARMSAFGPYSYLGEIAERYLDRKGLDQIDRGAWVSLLRRIDRRMTGAYGPAEWSALAAPLFTLIGPLPDLDGRVPAEVLRRFFVSRGADSLAAAMDGREHWSAVELHDAIAGVLAPGATPAETHPDPSLTAQPDEPAPDVDPPMPDDPQAVSTGTFNDVLAAPPAEKSESVPTADAIEEDPDGIAESASDAPETATVGDDDLVSAFGTPPPGRAESAPAGSPPEPEPDASEPLWQRLARAQAAAGSTDPLARLEARVLGDDAIAQRTWFVAEIAGGSEASYRRLLEGLDAAGSWSEAWPVLAEAFKANDVDLYSEAAIAITDSAERRFRGST